MVRPRRRRLPLILVLGLALLATAVPGPNAAADPPAEPAVGPGPLTGDVHASSAAAGAAAELALDGDPGTAWAPAADDEEPVLRLDLGRPAWLTSVRVDFTRVAERSVIIEASVDGDDWVRVVDRAGLVGRSLGEPLSGMFGQLRVRIQGERDARAVAELVVAGSTQGLDLAQGRPAEATSAADGHEARLATDGSTGTQWRAATGGTQTLTVDLGSPALVTGVRQRFAERGDWSFRIDGSPDGAQWTKITETAATGHLFAAAVPGDDGQARFRLIRLTITGAPEGVPAQSAGLEVYGYPDLALGSIATSVSAPAYPAEFAVDGDDATTWIGSDSRFPKTLEIDLRGRVQLRQLRQVFHDEDLYTYRIEASVDRKSWTKLVDQAEPKRGKAFVHDVEGHYRYLRLVVLSGNGRWASSIAFEALGLPIDRDLAAGVPLTSSSNVRGHEPARAVDADPDSYWQATTSRRSSLTVDLGYPAALSRIEQTFAARDAWNVIMEGSADGRGWTRLARSTGGEPRRDYAADVSGTYRWIRLTVAGSANGNLPSSTSLRVLGVGSPVATDWWERTGPVKRYFPKQYGLRWTEIEKQLPELRRQGFEALELAGFKEGPSEEFAGLGATDNFAVASELGTMAEFRSLIDAAHEQGLKVILFENLGYAHVTAPDFQQAIKDFAAGKDTPITRNFVFSKEEQGDRWYRDPGTGVWYYAFWGERLPSFNWETAEWRNEAAKILRFWMDRGADGVGLDAPVVYWGFTRELNNTFITDVLRDYNPSMMAEGINTNYEGKVQQTYLEMINDWGYTTVQDLSINFWGDANRNKIVPAMIKEDPSGLDAAFRTSRDAVVGAGGVQVEAPGWEADLTDGKPDPAKVVPAQQRLLEFATLTSAGSLFYISNGYHLYRPEEQTIAGWTDDQREQLAAIQRAQTADRSLEPAGGRVQLSTDDAAVWAFLRTDRSGGLTSLVILNYGADARSVTVDLAGTGIGTGARPSDLVGGRELPAVTGDAYTVEIDGHGYLELAVR
ncbi:discoidin domain-containing protein [Microlunatus speluncae]|uniref:discoidin domain-containing protein n=1 Tax=Microlunatus speluncae TaxID=2594267 RepID=UPI001375FDA3|nr:discoidin domain-containing protein [Microlunatus speluncae]